MRHSRLVTTPEQLALLDGVLNEATLRAVFLNEERQMAQVWLDCLALTPSGDEPDDSLFCFWLNGVTRIAASLRNGHWDDQAAEVVPFDISDLTEIVYSFGGTPVHGWEFFDPPDESWAHWRERLSLNHVIPGPGGLHVLDLFQEEGIERHLDLRLWFAEVWISQRDGPFIPAEEISTAARRWWDAMYAGDPRVRHHGIVPAGNWTPPPAGHS